MLIRWIVRIFRGPPGEGDSRKGPIIIAVIALILAALGVAAFLGWL